jgi:hypothetical protein
MGYFTNKAVEIRSLASFSIPGGPDGDEYGGIFNMESSKTSEFDHNERYFSTLYTMLYPSLLLTSKYLIYYKNYLINELTKTEPGIPAN